MLTLEPVVCSMCSWGSLTISPVRDNITQLVLSSGSGFTAATSEWAFRAIAYVCCSWRYWSVMTKGGKEVRVVRKARNKRESLKTTRDREGFGTE